MIQVCQLNDDGYFVGTTFADESPLEPGVYHIPANAIQADVPEQIEGKNIKWVDGSWTYEDISEPEVVELTYAQKRAKEYPPITDYLDAVVKGDEEQLQEYIDACLAVKAKYPKPE